MGERGPQPTPAAQKQLAADPGRKTPDMEEPVSMPGAPPRPHLSDEIAEDTWDILCEELESIEVLATSDQMIMQLFAETKSLWITAGNLLRSEGSVLEGTKGGFYVNPRANLETMYAKRLESYLVAMGLTAASRAGAAKTPKANTKEGKSRFFKVVG